MRLQPSFAFAACLILCASAAAQKPGSIPYGGSEVFRFAFYKKDIKPVTDSMEVWRSPRQSMVVILGNTSQLPFQVDGAQLREFVQNGGAVLIASDSTNQANFRPGVQNWGTEFGITISGQHVTAGNDQCYRGIQGRPFVRPRGRAWLSPSPADLVEGLDDEGANAVATDHPSEMTFRPPQGFRASNLAGYPVNARRVGSPLPLGANQNYFAVALEPIEQRGFVGPGRALVLADHSVFVNGMLGFREDPNADDGFAFDNANWKFSNRTIDWLKSGTREPRTQCLFIEDGRIVDKFAIEIPPTPKPPIPDIPPDVLANWLLNHSNRMIDEAQQKNFFNRLVAGWLGMPRLLRMFLLIVTAVFLFFCMRWLRGALRRNEPSATLTPTVQSRLLPRGGILKQRTAAQIDVGNLSEAAGRRVRERFDVLGGQPGPDGKIPTILTASDLDDAQVLRQSIRWLWSIGYGDGPIAVPETEWDRANALLERVTLRATRGDWSFGQNVA